MERVVTREERLEGRKFERGLIVVDPRGGDPLDLRQPCPVVDSFAASALAFKV